MDIGGGFWTTSTWNYGVSTGNMNLYMKEGVIGPVKEDCLLPSDIINIMMF